ncbi:MAG: signal peptidase I [Candidatus Magasanikbacteria bacterium]|nr:signal peptidase I [Candidatus Magasanikbacteria bacterium]
MLLLIIIILILFLFLIETAICFAWTKILGFTNTTFKTAILFTSLVFVWQSITFALSIWSDYPSLFTLLNIVGIYVLTYHIFKNKTDKKFKLYSFPFLFFLSTIMATTFFIFILRATVITPFYIQGHAMEPNFSDGDYLIIKKSKLNIAHGDVVIFNYINPENQKTSKFIKRVIGLPGEHIVINNEEIFIDDILLTEEKADYYYYGLSTSGTIDIILASDEYFMLGDNRDESFDSRTFGPVKKSQIIGEYWMKKNDVWNLLKK